MNKKGSGRGRRGSNGQKCRIYLITPPQIDVGSFPDMLARALDAGDVACVQLRLKGVQDQEIVRAAEALMPVCHERDVAFIVNDRADLAASCGADGVHIGSEDGDYASARAAVGADAIVGVSCYGSRHRGMEAAEAGADYVAFGAFFPTQTKNPPERADLSVISWWHAFIEIPSVAIGGITPENCPPLVKAGADFLAVISAVWDHAGGPAAAIVAFNDVIASAGSS